MAQKVEHSGPFKRIFQKNIRETEGGVDTNLLNIGAAKHRMVTKRKPRGRLVLYPDAHIATAEEIQFSRDSSSKNVGTGFLVINKGRHTTG